MTKNLKISLPFLSLPIYSTQINSGEYIEKSRDSSTSKSAPSASISKKLLFYSFSIDDIFKFELNNQNNNNAGIYINSANNQNFMCILDNKNSSNN